MYFDNTMLILIPAIFFAYYAQSKVKSTYLKYNKVITHNGYNGYETAKEILNRNGLNDVMIERVSGVLTDHYDPRGRVLRLSERVYTEKTISSCAIAAHEVGHAIQHATVYVPLKLRNAIIPFVNSTSQLSFILILIGIFFQFTGLITLGILFFASSVLFQILTLPVEFDASNRALNELKTTGILIDSELPFGKKVLNAAALTYLAAAATSIAQLIRLLIIRERSRD